MADADDMDNETVVQDLVDDAVYARSREVLPSDQTSFYGSPDDPELLFVELIPSRASVHDGDPGRLPAVWRSRSDP